MARETDHLAVKAMKQVLESPCDVCYFCTDNFGSWYNFVMGMTVAFYFCFLLYKLLVLIVKSSTMYAPLASIL